MHAGAADEDLAEDGGLGADGGEVDGGVAGVVGAQQEADDAGAPGVDGVGVEELGDGAEVAGLDGVPEFREGRLAAGQGARALGSGAARACAGEEVRLAVQRALRVREGGAGEGRHLAAERARHAAADVGGLEARQREQVRELGEGGLGGQVVAEDDAGGAEREARRVQRRHEAARALAHVDDDDAALHGAPDDARQAAVDAGGGVAHAEGLEHEPAEVRHAQHAVDHLGLDAREDAQRRDVRRVEVGA